MVHPQGRRRVRRPHGGVLDLYAEQPDQATMVCSTKSPAGSSAKRASRSRPHPDGSSASTTSLAATASSISSSSSTPTALARVKVTGHRTADDFALHARACRCRLPRSRRSASSSTTSPPTPPPLSTPPCRRPRRAACSGGSTTTTRPSASWLDMVQIEVGVSKANVSIAASKAVSGSSRDRVWRYQRIKSGAQIGWMFSPTRPEPMARAYPDPWLKKS